MRVGFLITARLKSSRLPRKALLPLAGMPALAHMIERIRRAKRIDTIVLCTSTNPHDEALAELAAQEGIGCYRGSEEDVLVRLRDAARLHRLDYLVNLTADCPLIDPIHIDAVVETYERTRAHLMLASRLPTGSGLWGLDVEAVERVCELKAETETECWVEYFTKAGEFRVHELEVDPSSEHQGLKTSLDYPEDYVFLQRVFAELYVPGRIFSLADILELVRRKPELLELNTHCKQRGLEHVARTAAPVKMKPQPHGAAHA